MIWSVNDKAKAFQIFTKEQLLEEIWGYDTDSDDTTVKTHISRIHNRFADWQEFTIVTIRGLGYKAECHRQNNRCAVTRQTVETIGILGNEA